MSRKRAEAALLLFLLTGLLFRLVGTAIGYSWLDLIGRIMWVIVLVPFLLLFLFILLGATMDCYRRRS